MYSLFVSIIVVAAILLVIIVLLQSSKGGGLAGTFGGASQMSNVFGSRRTADFLSRFTWWLAGIMAVLTLVVNLFFLPGQTTTEQRESIIQRSGRQTVPQQQLPPQQAPQEQTPQQQTPNQ